MVGAVFDLTFVYVLKVGKHISRPDLRVAGTAAATEKMLNRVGIGDNVDAAPVKARRTELNGLKIRLHSRHPESIIGLCCPTQGLVLVFYEAVHPITLVSCVILKPIEEQYIHGTHRGGRYMPFGTWMIQKQMCQT